LRTTASDQLGRVVVEQVFVDSEVLFFSQDSIVGLQAVFGEKFIVALGLDICRIVLLAQFEMRDQ